MAGITTHARMEAFKAGATRYSDGQPCAQGHRADRYTKTSECVVCNAERSAARRQKKRGRADLKPAITNPAPIDPIDQQTAEIQMTLAQHWQYVSPYRYAVEYQGHTLQTAPNPDPDDKRKYISIVDRKPIDAAPSWSLNEAKTKAIKAVQRLATAKAADRAFSKRPTAQAVPFPTDAPQPEPAPADPAPIDTAADLGADLGADLVADLPPCEPAAQVEAKAPEPDAARQLVEHTGPIETLPALSATRPDGLRAVFTVEVHGHDIIAALNALQSAADLLRSLGHVDCTIDLPAKINL
jgi:hypothetical protein